MTALVLVIVTLTKFTEGAWIIVALIPMLVLQFLAIHRHYETVAEQLSLKDMSVSKERRNIVIVPIGGVHRAVVQALDYARTLSADVRARLRRRRSSRHRGDPGAVGTMGARRSPRDPGFPFRSIMEPLLEYVGIIRSESPDEFITILLPEFVPAVWWHSSPPQSAGASHQGGPSVPAKRGRDERALPLAALKPPRDGDRT